MTKHNQSKPRNHHAVAARTRSGAGKHADKRTKRRRTRGSAKRAAIAASLALFALGCGTTMVVEPCDIEDAGSPIVVDDAGTDGGSAPGCLHINEANECVDPLITGPQACRLLENTQQAHMALRDDCDPLACPWSGIAGPGAPLHVCDPIRVVACIEAVDRTNNCVDMEAAIAACDPGTCWEAEQ